MVLHAIEGLTSSICQLKSLRVITLSGSKKLMVFPNIVENMEGLRGVYLDRTSTGELPASTERLGLDFNNCKRLVYLPDTTINLATLQWPTLCGCSKLSTLPEDLWYLRHFDVDRTGIHRDNNQGPTVRPQNSDVAELWAMWPSSGAVHEYPGLTY